MKKALFLEVLILLKVLTWRECDSLKITDVLSWMENSPLGRLMPNKNNGIHLSTIKIAKFEVELWKGLENPKHLIDSGENLTLDHDKIHISYRSTWSSIKVNARIANVEDNNTSKAVAESCDVSCGQSQYGTDSCNPVSERIIGGTFVQDSNRQPWQVFIKLCGQGCEKGCSMCGGTLLNHRWILTAMHCLQTSCNTIRTNIKVRLGSREFPIGLDSLIDGAEDVDKIVLNSGYIPNRIENDIALIRLVRPVAFSDQIQPACLPQNANDQYVGRWGIISGWGTTSGTKDESSQILKEGKVQILSSHNRKCRKGSGLGEFDSIPKTKMCAYALGVDACQGDSGGPLLIEENGRCVVAGIVSYGIDCAKKNFAGVYTRVNQFLSFIRDTIKPEGCGETAPSTPKPESNAHKGATDGKACDLTCSNVNDLKEPGTYKIQGILANCDKGFCTSMEEGIDLCEALENPCTENLATNPIKDCHNPCNLSFYFNEYLDNIKYEQYVTLNLYGLDVTCNQSGDCCDVDNPRDVNLCVRAALCYAGGQIFGLSFCG